MNGFEEFFDFLASKGVKSFHIEMQARELNETQERNIERALRIAERKDCLIQTSPAKHDIPVHRGEEPVPPIAPRTVQLVTVEELAAVERDNQRLEKDRAEMIAREEKDKAEGEEMARKLAAEKATVAAKQTNASVKAAAETKDTAAAENINPKKVYDIFCAKITTDDGTFTVEERSALIGRMGLDDLLRVNNDFSLGLDTDKAVDDVREDVKNCFR